MAKKDPQEISAQVILRPASGITPDGECAITADNVKDFLPAEETVKQAAEVLSGCGFKVTPVVGNSFSITATIKNFEKVFKTDVSYTQKGGSKFVNKKGKDSYELPRSQLPKELRESVVTITFTPPPDFGPSNFMM